MSDHDHIERLLGLGRRLIADQVKSGDIVGAAFDGSLATRRAWATSDLDFTIFPTSSAAPSEPSRVPAYRYYYSQGPLAKHHLYVDLRVIEGVFVNIHIKTKDALDHLVSGYPHTFIESAEWVPTDLESTHFLDGLGIMSIVEDSAGYLAGIKAFVARHRFAPEVLNPRLALMSRWAERTISESRQALAEGSLDIGVPMDLARCLAQMWLEAHALIYSKKEQDALLAGIAREAKLPQVHELYRSILGLDRSKETLKGILEPIAEYAERVDMMFNVVQEMATERVEVLGADVVERCKAFRMWAALSLKSVPIAFEKDCYAHMAFVMQGVGPGALNQFVLLLERVAPSNKATIEEACRAELERSRDIWRFFGHIEEARERTAQRLEAASQLLELTKNHLMGAQ